MFHFAACNICHSNEIKLQLKPVKRFRMIFNWGINFKLFKYKFAIH